MKATLYSPFVIETDIRGCKEDFDEYLNKGEWVDTNILYKDYEKYNTTMHGRNMVYHYVKHIDEYDFKLKKYIIKLFKELGIVTNDWRADFFLTKPGGSMPMHIDGMSKFAILIPLTLNTGPLVCETKNTRFSITYQNLTILNTQVLHGVESPTSDRLLFRLAIHDQLFENTGIYNKMKLG